MSEPLDLGPIEPGSAPKDRSVPEGTHPWAPSAIDGYAYECPHESFETITFFDSQKFHQICNDCGATWTGWREP